MNGNAQICKYAPDHVRSAHGTGLPVVLLTVRLQFTLAAHRFFGECVLNNGMGAQGIAQWCNGVSTAAGDQCIYARDYTTARINALRRCGVSRSAEELCVKSQTAEI